jgi:hypothetical protein
VRLSRGALGRLGRDPLPDRAPGPRTQVSDDGQVDEGQAPALVDPLVPLVAARSTVRAGVLDHQHGKGVRRDVSRLHPGLTGRSFEYGPRRLVSHECGWVVQG